ncbi:MAG: hypothetical protein WC376_02785 [Candidatus Nanoarchaeia archaeon]|jgi:lipoate-protein ligase A
MILYEKTPRLASENLAINRICAELVGNKEIDFLARFYYHKKGVILANNQSLNDLYTENCKNLTYEISKRPSGGSAIIVNPELALCYSLFFKPDFLSTRFDFNTAYKKITFELIKNLGQSFRVKGNYYLRYNGFPIAGHAMKNYSNSIQFDGVLHLLPLNVYEASKLIKLRKLGTNLGKKYVFMENQVYNLRGNAVKLKENELKILINEEEELGKIIGLSQTNLTLDEFLAAFYKTINALFGKQELLNEYSFDSDKIKKYEAKILSKDYLMKGRTCLGHCFIDLLEPEEEF